MENSNKKAMPKCEEEYKVNYVFDEMSEIDLNEVIKDCFEMQISNLFSK